MPDHGRCAADRAVRREYARRPDLKKRPTCHQAVRAPWHSGDTIVVRSQPMRCSLAAAGPTGKREARPDWRAYRRAIRSRPRDTRCNHQPKPRQTTSSIDVAATLTPLDPRGKPAAPPNPVPPRCGRRRAADRILCGRRVNGRGAVLSAAGGEQAWLSARLDWPPSGPLSGPGGGDLVLVELLEVVGRCC